MNGRERISQILASGVGLPENGNSELLPVMPIIHSGLAPLFGVSLGTFFTQADMMARVIVRGCREFGLDGVQLSMGVTAEAEALGARVLQPPDGGAVLKEYLLADLDRLDNLYGRNPCAAGRMPLFFSAVHQVVREVGQDTFVLATMRGPLLMASQLRGVETLLMDMLDRPDRVARVLDLTTEVAAGLGRWLLASGAHGLVLGEATCSPNFISPRLYRHLVLPRHRQLVGALKAAGWGAVGLHICGNTAPILEDIVSTGVHFMDLDYQVPAEMGLALARGRIALRGNLDPSAVFRFGAPQEVAAQTRELCRAVAGQRWILSSGCDIPPGTPGENIAAFVSASRS